MYYTKNLIFDYIDCKYTSLSIPKPSKGSIETMKWVIKDSEIIVSYLHNSYYENKITIDIPDYITFVANKIIEDIDNRVKQNSIR